MRLNEVASIFFYLLHINTILRFSRNQPIIISCYSIFFHKTLYILTALKLLYETVKFDFISKKYL